MLSIKKSLALFAIMPVLFFSQPVFSENTAMNTAKIQNVLTQRQSDLAQIAAYTAVGDLEQLQTAVNSGLNNGLTVAEVKDLMAQLYAYCGFPRSLNALGVLDKTVKERLEKGIKTEAGVENKIIDKKIDSLKAGTETQTKLIGKAVDLSALSADVDYYLKAHLFGDIFSSSVFSWQEREIITVAALSAMRGMEPQRDAHINIAKHNNISDEQIAAIRAIAEKGKN